MKEASPDAEVGVDRASMSDIWRICLSTYVQRSSMVGLSTLSVTYFSQPLESGLEIEDLEK